MKFFNMLKDFPLLIEALKEQQKQREQDLERIERLEKMVEQLMKK